MDSWIGPAIPNMSNPYVVGALACCLAYVVVYCWGKREKEFPDYFALSGIPLPAPLKYFDVDTAQPRPYRPFRW